MSIDLRHFRSFVAVAEEGRIGRAARRLYITQPALSRQMQQLEREIGATLLVRGPHGVELTDVGRELLAKARVALEAAESALAVGQPEQPHGRLVLGLPLAGGRDRWFALTQAFVERFPAVEVEMREALSEQLQRQVLDRELDGALAMTPRRLPGLTYAHVMDDRLSVWLHPGHPLATRPQLDPRRSARPDDHARRRSRRERLRLQRRDPGAVRRNGHRAALRRDAAALPTGTRPRPRAISASWCRSTSRATPSASRSCRRGPCPIEFVRRAETDRVARPRLRALRRRPSRVMRGRHDPRLIGIGSRRARGVASPP